MDPPMSRELDVPVGVNDQGKTFRKMLIVDPATFKTPEPPAISAKEKRQAAPARPPRVQEQQPSVLQPMAESTPMHVPAPRVLDFEEQPPPPQAAAQAPQSGVVDKAAAVWVAQAGLCIPPNIPNAKKKQWAKLLERLARTVALKPTTHGEVQVQDEHGIWTVIRGANYLDVLRALMVDAGYETAGLCEAVEALKIAGVPIAMLGSDRAKQLYTMGHSHTHGDSSTFGSVADVLPGKAPRVLRVHPY